MIRAILISLAIAAAILFLASRLNAGHPACDTKGHGSPCDMKSCAAIGKNGKTTGTRCTAYCAKGCCFCSKTCPRDYPGPQQNPDEEGNTK
jgi:hypothetical protein